MRSPCLFCGAPSPCGVCESCRAHFEKIAKNKPCDVLFADAARTVFDYRDKRIRAALFSAKRRGLRVATEFFASACVEAAGDFCRRFSCVTYVPRRREARLFFGVDQARLLARAIARRLGVPCLLLLKRRGSSARQHGLPRAARFENVRGKFVCYGVPRGTILLVDDIITTTASASEACRTLRKAGAEEICVLAPARGGVL